MTKNEEKPFPRTWESLSVTYNGLKSQPQVSACDTAGPAQDPGGRSGREVGHILKDSKEKDSYCIPTLSWEVFLQHSFNLR